jgi:hypothetical protein
VTQSGCNTECNRLILFIDRVSTRVQHILEASFNPEALQVLQGLRSICFMWADFLSSTTATLASLQELRLWHCHHLETLPDCISKLQSPVVLDLTQSEDFNRLPSSLGRLAGLTELNLPTLYQLNSLPDSISQLHSLQILSCRQCIRLQRLPDGIGKLSSLLHLNLTDCTELLSLPDSTSALTSLTSLQLLGCLQLQRLPDLQQLEQLPVQSSAGSLPRASLPYSIGRSRGMQHLHLWGQDAMQQLPYWPKPSGGQVDYDVQGFYRMQSLPSPQNRTFVGIRGLRLWGCKALQGLPDSVAVLTDLQSLNMWGCKALETLPHGIGALTGLTMLNLQQCAALKSLPDSMGALTSLGILDLSGCKSLQLHALPASFLDLPDKCEVLTEGSGCGTYGRALMLFRA